MTQEYRILWFEDNPDFVESLTDSIEEHVESMGFEFSCEIKPDDSELSEEWLKKVDPDLIIVDYGLGSGTKGNVVVEKIRVIEPYADVIFYSGKIEDYIDKISRKIDGVFFTIRSNLLEKTLKLINRSVRKQQEPNNMRGLIIAEAVYIEGKMDDLILVALGTDDERKNVIKKLLDPKWQVLTFKKKYDLINKICKERIKTLNRAKNGANQTKKDEIDAKISDVKQRKIVLLDAEGEVIDIRNIMAHAIEDKDTGCLTSYVRKDDPITVDDNFCKETRKNLQKHSENLDELKRLISANI